MLDRVYVVHLPHAERRAGMDAELARMGLAAQYVHASPPDPGFSMTNMRRNPRAEFGVALSHLKAVSQSDEDALFIEDDVRFLCDRRRLDAVIAELPPDWDVCYFGGHPRSATRRISESLVRVGTFSFAEAYLLRGAARRDFLAFWCDRAGKDNAMYDLVLGEFAAARNGYCAYPLLTEQAFAYSHVSGRVDSKAHLLDKGWATHAPC